MLNTGRIGVWVFLIFMLLFQLPSEAQSKKYFVITGKIVPDIPDKGTGEINIKKNDADFSTVEIPKNGRFRLELEFFNEYSLTFKYPGHFNKVISVSTQIPQEVWERDNDFPAFPMIVQLSQEFEGIDKSFTLKPTGRIFYGKDIDNFEKESFIPDLQLTEQIAAAKTKASQVQKEAQSISKENDQDLAAKQKDFDNLIKEADAQYQRGEYQLALMSYMGARKLFPDKAYPSDRVAELQDLVKALEITEKQKTELEQKYKTAIAKANGLYDTKSYKDARPIYVEALQYKPGDVFANGRINEIDQLIPILEKQQQYKALVDKADNNYKSKSYDQAINFYTQAKAVIPTETYPQSQIDLINKEREMQAKAEQLEREFNQAMQTANTMFQQKDFLQALNSYKKALELKPDNKLAKDKLAETELAIVAAEKDKKYQEIIELADQAMTANDFAKAKAQYQEALKLNQSQSYPKEKLAEITKAEANEIKISGILEKAEKAYNNKDFDGSLALFNQALEMNPKSTNIQKRIEDIQNLKKLQLADKEYTDLIAQADEAFRQNQLDASLTAYNKALTIRNTETYPKDQIRKIGDFQALIKTADASFGLKDYTASLPAFRQALIIIPANSYASGKVSEIEKILKDQKQLEESAKAELLAYNETIKNADQFFAAKNYTEALNKYKEASQIKTTETYPKDKIKEVETILDSIKKDKVLKEQEYQVIIAQGDQFLNKKDYTNAQGEYLKAITLKPDDTYPKNQIKKINDTLAENRRIEAEQLKQKQEKLNADYNLAMANADKSFSGNDFISAKNGYETALTIKPGDEVAKTKLEKTAAKIAEMAQMAQAYQTAIADADRLFTTKSYLDAKNKFQEALKYQPDSDYPKNQIVIIDAAIERIAAEAKIQKEYDQEVEKGELLLKNKDLANAKLAFSKAYNMKPSEIIPPKRIEEINDLLASQAEKEAKLKAKQEAYQDAIKRADQQLSSNDYNTAKTTYNEALKIKPEEKYPNTQLALIETLLKEQIEQNYKAAIDKANRSFDTNQFDDATAAYHEALQMKVDDPYAKNRLKEIEQKKLQIAADKEYDEYISQADQSLRSNELDAALATYNKALLVKKAETYPKDQIKKINDFHSTIKIADNSFGLKDYPASLKAFNQALALIPGNSYASGKISEIEQILNEKKQLDEKEKAEMIAYTAAIKVADQLFTAKNYTESINKYKEASNIKTSESYPKNRMKEIENILEGIEKEKLRKEQEYQAVLANADNLLEKKDYVNAQKEYEKASALKAEDTYPKEQIKRISDTLAENRRAEEEKLKQQQDKLNADYTLAINNADKSFSINDFELAKIGYETALSLKPNDAAAKQKLGQAEAKLAQITRMNQAYSKAINEANKLLTDKNYKEAKGKYQESLQYQPDSEYPKTQLTKIDELLAQQEAEIKIKKDFDDAVANGESLLKNKDLTKAKEAFMKAYNLIPSENIPPKRIEEINGLIANQAQEEAQLKATLAAYQEAIQKADKNFGNKEYSTAKLGYNEAKLIKPDEKYPSDQLALIEKLVKEQNEQDYKAAIAKGDNLFALKKYDDASDAYQEALKIKKDDIYASRKITEIEAKKNDLAAENDRQKKIQDQYRGIIAQADNDFKNKDYQQAKEKYKNALELRPNDTYPEEKITAINVIFAGIQKEESLNTQYSETIKAAQVAYNENKLQVALDLFKKGNTLKPSEPLPPIRIAEIEKKLAQQEETARLTAMEEAQRIAKEKADKLQYDNAIAAADKAFAAKQYKVARSYYVTALIAMADEKYPKDQISKIDELVAQENMAKDLAFQQAKQDSLQKAKDKVFNMTMAAAKDYEQNKQYDEAILKYTAAVDIKPEQKSAIQKLINDINDNIQLLAKQDAEYKRIIKLADDYYSKSLLKEALAEYRNAATVKSDETYPKNQIREIQTTLSGKELAYTNAIGSANKAFDGADWETAKTAYSESLSLKPKEVYPLNRLKEVNQKLADIKLAAKENSTENKAYKEAIEKADKLLSDDQLVSAKMQFQVAQTLNPNDKLPAQKITEIDGLIEQRSKNRLADSQHEIDEKYRQALSVADNSFQEKTYSIARLKYQQAQLIKPNESYPKNQIALIDKLLNETKPKEAYVAKTPDPLVTQQVEKNIYNPNESAQATEARAQSYKTINDYGEAIKKADDMFGIKDYAVARFYYYKASELNPAESYPKNQLELIRKMIDSQLSASDITGYDQAISQADNAFAKNDYNIAKFFYYKALDIKSWEKYPKDRINEILALTNSLLSEKEEKEYRDVIAKADEAYFNKDIAISRFYYNKAIAMKKDENYPRIKLKDIQKLIEQDLRDQENEKYRKLIDDGDQAFEQKNYSIARFNYNKAITMKPNEKYPKDQLKSIKEALDKKDN